MEKRTASQDSMQRIRRSGSLPNLNKKLSPKEDCSRKTSSSIRPIRPIHNSSLCLTTQPQSNTKNPFVALQISRKRIEELKAGLATMEDILNLDIHSLTQFNNKSREEIYCRLELEYVAFCRHLLSGGPKTAIVSPFSINPASTTDNQNNISPKTNNHRKFSDGQITYHSPSKCSGTTKIPEPTLLSHHSRSNSVSDLLQESSTVKCEIRERKFSFETMKYNNPLVTGRSAFIKSNNLVQTHVKNRPNK